MKLKQGDYLNLKGVDRETVAKVLLAFEHNGCNINPSYSSADIDTTYTFNVDFLDYIVKYGWLGWDISGINTALLESDFERNPSRRRLELADLDINDPRDRAVDGNYLSLRSVLDRAYQQASAGKGAERHGQDQAFEHQPMQVISGLVGSPDGMAYQAIKKIQEQQRFTETDRKVKELLGAIVYISGMIIHIENQDNE